MITAIFIAGAYRNTFSGINSTEIKPNPDNTSAEENSAKPENMSDLANNSTENPISPVSIDNTSIFNPEGDTIYGRISVPEGYERMETTKGSFAYYLQNLPLKPHGSKVKYYDGGLKTKEVYDAVIDIDVGERDLQQCADAVMRLWGEYLYGRGEYERIHFNFTNGFRVDYSKWMEGYRIVVEGNKSYWVKRENHSDSYADFRKYMDIIFAYAGTMSLIKEMEPVDIEDMKIGDVFIQSSPGHCVIVVDMAVNPLTGEKLFMIAQSYMPAQDIHILKNMSSSQISPWYSLDFGDKLSTPEWTFYRNDLRRFK